MVSAYCSCQIDSSRKGTKRAGFDLFDTAAFSVWGFVVEKVQVSQLAWFVVGSHLDSDFGFVVGIEVGGVAGGHLELVLLHRGGSGVELGWASKLWRVGWSAVPAWRPFREGCR